MLVINVPTTPGTFWPCGQPVGDDHVQQLVAVVQAPGAIDQLQAIGVAVEGDAVVGVVLLHGLQQRRRARWRRSRR